VRTSSTLSIKFRSYRRGGVLSALLLVWPIAFFFFGGAYASVMLWDFTKYVGPFYYLPMALVMALAIGVGIMRLTRHAAVGSWR
jgi:hypothetical protein